MATENPMRIMAASGMRTRLSMGDNTSFPGGTGLSSSSSHEGAAQEIGMLLRSHQKLDNTLNRRESLPYRSGSAPPSVQGSRALIDGLSVPSAESGNSLINAGAGDVVDAVNSEQQLRSDPAYLAYYYSHINLNPRLPPPIISRENYVLAQRLAAGGFTDKKKVRALDDNNSRSLFSQPVLPTHNEEAELYEDEKMPTSNLLRHAIDNWEEKGVDGVLGMTSHGLGARPKSLVDLIQEDFPRTPSPVYNHSRSSSRLANEEPVDGASALDAHVSQLREVGMSAATVAELSAALLSSRSATSNVVLGSRSVTPTPGLSSLAPASNPGGVHLSSTVSSSLSSGPARIPTPKPPSTDDGFEDLSGLTNAAIVGAQSLDASLVGASSSSGATDLATTLQALNLSSRQTAASTEQPPQLHLPVESQQLQQEMPDQHQSLRLQRHNQRSQTSQIQAQISQSHVFSQALHQQQQFSVAEQGFRGQGKYGLLNLASQSQNTAMQPGSANNMYAAAAAAAAMSYMAAGNPYYQNLQGGNLYGSPYNLAGYPVNPALIPGMMTSYPPYDTPAAAAAAAAAAVAAGMGARTPGSGSLSGGGLDMQQLYKYASQTGTSRLPDPLYLHYLQQQSVDDARAAVNANESSSLRGYASGTSIDTMELQKSQLSSVLGYPNEQKSQFSRSGSLGIPIGSKSGSVSPVYYGSPPGVGFVMPFPNSPISSPVLPGSPVVPGALSLRQADRSYRYSSGNSRASAVGAFVGWQGQRASETEELKGSSLLEELKNNKSRRFELADITGHVAEFSADQHGSRFIQQKLESASAEEKAIVFREVLPQALSLMTDVFGNYVIQKFFEHGTPEQRLELANQLLGHVLSLSLQMYGCRVIQKALEVVDVEQQIRIIAELDGHVMRCVRDQNGNHVIQKCIECVPPEHIQFIISAFYGQVVILSTHPYGCRVIQRVLEHCTDEQKQNGIMEDILHSTCSLAQDQYGNYVVQHVLEHGKPHERSEILTKLAGQIVQMSQHKFASNVVEKCLEFGGPAERQILISEMLGHNDENEPLQAMMKDQYANYVVQKVLETCDDQQRELLLSRIRVHLHALKKYTYGKHIVARVEKLVAAGERRGAQVLSL